jgi:hypothetical protein
MKRLIGLVVACAILVTPRAVSACPASVVPALLVASEAADAATTIAGIRYGAREANPMLQPFAHSAPLLVGVMITTDFARHGFQRARGASCGQQNTGDLIMIVLHGLVAAHNASLMHR